MPSFANGARERERESADQLITFILVTLIQARAFHSSLDWLTLDYLIYSPCLTFHSSRDWFTLDIFNYSPWLVITPIPPLPLSIGRRRAFFLAVSTYAIFTVPLLWIRNAPLRFLFRFLQVDRVTLGEPAPPRTLLADGVLARRRRDALGSQRRRQS